MSLGIAAYFRIASIQYQVNQSTEWHDQHDFLREARLAYESGFTYTGDRNRMPLYPWVLALFYSPELSGDEFFARSKNVNIAVSLVCMLALSLAFFRRFSALYAGYALVLIAFLIFALKSPWTQPELPLFTFMALAFALCIESIREPAWGKSIAIGALFALAHYAKASGILGLGIYSCSFLVVLLAQLLGGDRNRRALLRVIGQALAPAAAFGLLLFPYFNENKARYGEYLYNVNTTFYMWYDSWHEAKAGTLAAGDRVGWPDMPAEDIPSLEKYLAEHSLEEIVGRFDYGMRAIRHWACVKFSHYYVYGYCTQFELGAQVALVGLAALFLQRRGRLSAREWQACLFALAFFAIYAMTIFWYQTIVSHPRFILPLFIPALWTFGLIGEARWLRGIRVKICGSAYNPPRLAWWLLLFLALFQVLELVTFRAFELSGG